MIDKEILAQMNGKYVMPPDAGPAWRAAYAQGFDMSLIEENLGRSPWERLLANDRALAQVRTIQNGKTVSDGTAY